MGLMLGEFVDDYTVQCVDVFAMPQSGTSVSVESVDPVFQQQMLEMLKQTGRYGMGRNFVVVRISLASFCYPLSHTAIVCPCDCAPRTFARLLFPEIDTSR